MTQICPPELAQELVSALFRSVLRREPDPGGLAAYQKLFLDRLLPEAIERVVGSLVGSDEFARLSRPAGRLSAGPSDSRHYNALSNLSIEQISAADENFLRSALPKDDHGDRLFHFMRFTRFHKRKPSNAMLFDDYLYRMMTSDEIKNPLRVFVADKQFVKHYVSSIVGNDYTVPTLGIIEDISSFDSYIFAENCCIKPTHLSGAVFLKQPNMKVDPALLKLWMKINYYENWRERQYKFLKPKIILEPLIFNRTNLVDYKFHCYRGNVNLIGVDIDRSENHTRKLFDKDWNEVKIEMNHPRYLKDVEQPNNFREMKFIASKLSKDFEYIRVDMYSDGKQCLVGELTNTPGSGCNRFSSFEDEKAVSEIIFG